MVCSLITNATSSIAVSRAEYLYQITWHFQNAERETDNGQRGIGISGNGDGERGIFN